MKRCVRSAIGLLTVSVLSVIGLTNTSSQEATPPPYFEPPAGFNIDALASTPNMRFAADTTISVGIDRYTYEPGVSFELEYHGPVLYVVEQGKLAVSDTNGLVFIATYDGVEPSPPPLGITEGDEYILLPSQSVFADDGRLGRTRNAGDETLVVLVLLIVKDPGGMMWDVTGDLSATPMNEFEFLSP